MDQFKCFDKKWKKTGSSNFEAFIEKNPNQSTNIDDILMTYSFSENDYVCNVTFDGKHKVEVKMVYDGIMENKHFMTYFIVSGRNSDGNFEHVFQNADHKPMKTQTISFEDSGKKMIFTESGNGVSMTTIFEAC